MDYIVKIEAYEGPLEILLDLIKKNKFDIHDLPISQLTSQYLESIEKMKTRKIEVTSEFMDLASWLLLIKSRVCLPKQEEIDPREELMNQLLDYQEYKKSVDKMREWKEFKDKFLKRQHNERIKKQKQGSISDLIATYEKILLKQTEIEKNNRLNDLLNEFKNHRYTIEEQMSFVLLNVKKGKIKLDELLLSLSCKDEMIVTFMAILELIRSDIDIAPEKDGIFLEVKKMEDDQDEHSEE